MLVDKQSQLMSDLLFTVHQHGGDDVTWKPPINKPQETFLEFSENALQRRFKKRKFAND